MKENNKGSMIILTVIGIATLLVAVIGATFAYFTVTIDYKTPPTESVVKSTTMIVEYETKNEIIYEGAIPGRPDADFENNKLRFSLTSHQNLTSITEYDVYLVIDKSEFVKNPEDANATDELVYTMKQTEHTTSSPSITNDTTGAQGIANYTNNINGVQYNPETLTINKKDETTGNTITEEVIVGLIPSNVSYAEDIVEEDKIRIKVGSGKLASHSSIDSWELEIWLKETENEQNYNQGKTMEAYIDIVVTGSGYASNEVITTTP